MKKILFYITGHGLGHATRVIETINQLNKISPDTTAVISTSAPKWIFDEQLNAPFEYIKCQNSIGAIQQNSQTVDTLATLKHYSEYMKTERKLILEQLDFVKKNKIATIVSDISATAFIISAGSGIPGIAITNFSWDWIYEPYIIEHQEYEHVVKHIRRCYSLADKLLRLPFYGELSAFKTIEDIPLIAKKSDMKTSDVYEACKIDPRKKIVLIYLGDFDYTSVLTDKCLACDDYYFLTPEECKKSNIPFQAILKASAAILTKPGYGIVSESIANQTPIMYVHRRDFAEYYPLVEGIKKYAHNCFVPDENLENGSWMGQLDELVESKFDWPKVAVNGAEIAAKIILKNM